LTAARLRPVPGDAALPPRKHSLLDRLYQRFNAALDRLLHAVGLPPTPTSNENKILVHAPITRLLSGAKSRFRTTVQRSWARGPAGRSPPTRCEVSGSGIGIGIIGRTAWP
jgi:hypothetical protein